MLDIEGKVRVPPTDPPMYPISEEPEQPLQDTVLAPEARMLEELSASGVVSLGPDFHVPDGMSRIQFTWLDCVCYVYVYVAEWCGVGYCLPWRLLCRRL